MAYRASSAGTFSNAVTTFQATATGAEIDDDVLIGILFGTNGSGANQTGVVSDDGMTLLSGYPKNNYGTGDENGTFYLFHKKLAAAETAWDFSWTTTVQGGQWFCWIGSGRHATTPIHVDGLALQTPTSTTANYPGLTTSVDGCDIVWMGAWRSTASTTTAHGTLTGTTARTNSGAGSGPVNWRRLHTADEVQATAGAISAKSSAFGSGSAHGYAGAIALAPPATGGTPQGAAQITGASTLMAAATRPRSVETLRPNASLTLTNLSGAFTDIDDDPDSPDATWLVSP